MPQKNIHETTAHENGAEKVDFGKSKNTRSPRSNPETFKPRSGRWSECKLKGNKQTGDSL